MPEEAAGPTILLIEDDASIRRVATLRLEREGYRVVTALDGNEGLALAKAQRPQLILLDLMMPAMDGREVFRRLKTDPATAGIPVILFTVAAESELDELDELRGAYHVMKPYEPDELLHKVRQALAGPRPEGA